MLLISFLFFAVRVSAQQSVQYTEEVRNGQFFQILTPVTFEQAAGLVSGIAGSGGLVEHFSYDPETATLELRSDHSGIDLLSFIFSVSRQNTSDLQDQDSPIPANDGSPDVFQAADTWILTGATVDGIYFDREGVSMHRLSMTLNLSGNGSLSLDSANIHMGGNWTENGDEIAASVGSFTLSQGQLTGELNIYGIPFLAVFTRLGDLHEHVHQASSPDDKEPCQHCHEEGMLKCSWCGGDGGFKCLKCGGDGVLPDGRPCDYEYCEHGWVKCGRCHGEGKIECEYCGGKGYLLGH